MPSKQLPTPTIQRLLTPEEAEMIDRWRLLGDGGGLTKITVEPAYLELLTGCRDDLTNVSQLLQSKLNSLNYLVSQTRPHE